MRPPLDSNDLPIPESLQEHTGIFLSRAASSCGGPRYAGSTSQSLAVATYFLLANPYIYLKIYAGFP